MSEYQYYEFQAIDRPLSKADRQALRELSTRAQITATSFTNTYDYGDFKGDPTKLMEQWFDLHLYLANWGSRRLMIRLPARMLDPARIETFLEQTNCAALDTVGENLILDVMGEEVGLDDWDDGTGWLAALAPLRAEILAGDLRLFYLLWLMAVQSGDYEPDEPEPLPGIGPMSASLEAFAGFFGIAPDLVEAAAERSSEPDEISADTARNMIAAMPDDQKTGLLLRLFEGVPHVATELRAEIRERLEPGAKPAPAARRTVGELQARAQAIRLAQEQTEAERAAKEQRRLAEKAEKDRRERLAAIARRGERVWPEIEAEIGRRNGPGYDKAAALLTDLKVIAGEQGTVEDFLGRLREIRAQHAAKGRFIERLAGIG
jgi:hypothetical protein